MSPARICLAPMGLKTGAVPATSDQAHLLQGASSPNMQWIATNRKGRIYPAARSRLARSHRSGSRRAFRSRPGANGFRRPIPDPGRIDRSCRSQRIRRPLRIGLVLVAQLLLGRAPKLLITALGLPACSHKRCARSLISCSVGSDNCISSCEARPALGGMGSLEAGHARQRSAATPARGFKR
ncbi:hypothetical protein ACVWYH_010140 [Bradyrhizobium sp. GM24.11]